MNFLKGFLGGEKKSKLHIFAGALAIVFILALLFTPSTEVESNENQGAEPSVADEFTSQAQPFPDVDFYIRIQNNGKTFETLNESETESISQDYVISSDHPFLWPADIIFQSDTDLESDFDLEDETASIITLTVVGIPRVSTLIKKTPDFEVSTTPDGKNTIVIIKSGDPGTFSFEYENRVYYFSVARS